MRVSVEGGKYTYVVTETNAHVLRYGELWKDATGDKFTYSMAAEIESLREQVEKLTKIGTAEPAPRVCQKALSWCRLSRHLRC